ncbi:hypothetical protein MTR67_002594, partial [Solanum verrucosum]
MGHKIRNCPSIARNEGDDRRRAQPYPSSGPSGGWKQDRFYDLQTQEDHEGSPDAVILVVKTLVLYLGLREMGLKTLMVFVPKGEIVCFMV